MRTFAILAQDRLLKQNKRSINEKTPNPSGERERKNKRLRLGFFSNNPKHALPLQRGVKQFHYCELSNGQVSRSFLVVLEDPVDLVCSQNRGSGPRRLDVHSERGNSLCRLNAYCKESNFVYQKEVVDLVGSIQIAGRVILCTVAILVFRVGNQCKQAQA